MKISQMAALSVCPAVLMLLLFLLTAGTAVAQGQGRGRSWKRGALRVEDFGSMVALGDKSSSHLEYAITYSLGGNDEGAHTYIYCRPSAVMYPAASWMAEGHRTEQELTYNQAIFDLVEVHRRQLMRQAFVAKKHSQYDLLLANEMQQLNREVSVLQVATDYGRDSATLEHIRLTNRQWLNDNPGGRPVFEPRRYWWILGMEFGVDLSTGFISEVVTPSIGSSGFFYGLGWNRHGLYFRLVNSDVLSRDSVMSYTGEMLREPLVRVDAQVLGYGYTLIDRTSYSITPYVAIGTTSLEWYMGDSYTLGVMGLYHFHHWHSIKDGAKGKARCFTPSAMANLFVSYSDFGNGDHGLTFGLHLGLTFKSRREYVTWQTTE